MPGGLTLGFAMNLVTITITIITIVRVNESQYANDVAGIDSEFLVACTVTRYVRFGCHVKHLRFVC